MLPPGDPGSVADPASADGSAGEPAAARRPRRRLSLAALGTALFFVIVIGAGLLSALMVTPAQDEDVLPRPDDGAVVLAAPAPLSWDPAAIADTGSALLLSQLFEGLTVLDADSVLHPALAESWQLEEDGRRLVFTLRDGLTFSDGTSLDAEDVRRSWLRVLDPDRPSPLASLLDDISGAAAYARGVGAAEEVGIHADGRRLSVDFTRPAAYFPAVAAVPSLAVVPEGIEEQAAGPQEDRPFTASGAYVPIAAADGQIRLRANAAYWAGEAPTGDITILTDLAGRSPVDVFEDGSLDWTSISADDAAWIRYDRELGPQLRHSEDLAVSYLGFDTRAAPFDDPVVRRAVAMAVDWRSIAAREDPDGEVPTSLVPPGTVGRGEGDHLLAYDPEAAREALAEAGYPDGEGFPTVTLSTYGVGNTAAIAYELERELGIEVTVEARSFDDHNALLASDSPAMWTMAWSADYPHAHDFLGLLLRSDSTANAGHWANAEYDRLVDAAAATADPEEQVRLYDEAQDIIRDEVPIIPLGYGGSWTLSREGLRGAAVTGTGLMRYAELDREG
jgi:ABC-type oligopeptide transport system substrate-binding subunit